MSVGTASSTYYETEETTSSYHKERERMLNLDEELAEASPSQNVVLKTQQQKPQQPQQQLQKQASGTSVATSTKTATAGTTTQSARDLLASKQHQLHLQTTQSPSQPMKGILLNSPSQQSVLSSGSSTQFTTESVASSKKSSPKSVSIAGISSIASKQSVITTTNRSDVIFVEEMKKAFKMIDSDGDELISKNELAVAIRSYGMDPSTKDINDLFHMAGSKDGQLDINQFSTLMKKKVNSVLFENDNKKRRAIEAFFDKLDKNGDGHLSYDEFKEALESLPTSGRLNPQKDVEIIGQILANIDRNGDGVIDIGEFVEAMYRNKNLFEKCKTLFEPTPLTYINLFKSLPSCFRTSAFHHSLKSGKFSSSKFITPTINSSGINFMDLTLDTCSKNILPIYAKNFRVSMYVARGIPLPSDHVKILERKVYVSLMSNGTHISNIYQISAYWNPNKPDEWNFTNELDNRILVRTMTEDISAQLVFEFVIVIEGAGGEKGQQQQSLSSHEITCGHANFSIMNGDYQNQKNYELFLMGGTLAQPVDIPQEDIIFNRPNVVGKLNMLIKGVPKPQLSLRVSLVTSPKDQQDFCNCPPNIIMDVGGCEIVSVYRKMLAKKLFPTRVLNDRMIESNCCELRWFPHIMDDHDLWLIFLEKWKQSLTASRKTKDRKPHEHLLSKLVKDVYSVAFCTNIPKQLGRQTILNLFYDNPKEILNSAGLIFKPFDASETILQPIFSK